jgi:RNA polymerase sigma factor (sigma-70 family)
MPEISGERWQELYDRAFPQVYRARESRMTERGSDDPTIAVIQRLEVGRLLALLTERQRAIVVAQYYLGRPKQEIAEALGVGRGTVSATVSQSLARIRERGAQHA